MRINLNLLTSIFDSERPSRKINTTSQHKNKTSNVNPSPPIKRDLLFIDRGTLIYGIRTEMRIARGRSLTGYREEDHRSAFFQRTYKSVEYRRNWRIFHRLALFILTASRKETDRLTAVISGVKFNFSNAISVAVYLLIFRLIFLYVRRQISIKLWDYSTFLRCNVLKKNAAGNFRFCACVCVYTV